MSITFLSTRNPSLRKSFKEALIEGLAPEGGLFLPASLPDFSSKLSSFRGLSYAELAREIIRPFCDDLPGEALKACLEKSYSSFSHPETAPLVRLRSQNVLELFHGPTLAFKDFALQFLGNLFEFYLKKDGGELNVIGATSGDTGSAAIHGLMGKKGVRIFILYPLGRVSEIQELQMTTTQEKNVNLIAIEGTFDDAQSIVKSILGDAEFNRERKMAAVNSINFARILAQTVYYFYAHANLNRTDKESPLRFSVPTGNFGNVYSGWLAKKMGLPIGKFTLAVNENDILARCLNHGDYSLKQVRQTLSPSMDIQVASNFERYLFHLSNGEGQAIRNKMESLKSEKKFTLNAGELEKASADFEAVRVDAERVKHVIESVYRNEGYLLDPHSAIGYAAAEETGVPNQVCLATAHAAKFGETLREILPEVDPEPPEVKALRGRPKNFSVLPPDAEKIKEFIRTKN